MTRSTSLLTLVRPVAAAALGLCLAAPSLAVELWDEALQGDLQGNQATPDLVGSFSAGVNTAEGQLYRPSNVGGQGDTFAVTLLAGQVLQSLSLEITQASTSPDTVAATLFVAPLNGQSFSTLRQIHPISGVGIYSFNLPGSLASALPSDLILGLSLQFASSANVQSSMNWQWTATVNSTVSEVPEPAVLPMMLAGLGLLGTFVRRRRQD